MGKDKDLLGNDHHHHLQVDSSGVHVNNEGNYGFCPDSTQCTTSVAPKSNSGSAVVFFRVKPN